MLLKLMNILKFENEMKEVHFNLEHIVDYTIKHFENLKKKYGKERERKTEIRNFDNIEATKVVVANEKLYVNYEEGFAGTGLKKINMFAIVLILMILYFSGAMDLYDYQSC